MSSVETDIKISLDFLSHAFGSDFEITEYKVKDGTKPGDNFMSLIYSVEMKCKNKEGALVTRNLLLKCYPAHPARQEFNNKCNIFYKELETYRLWIPELRRFQTEVVGFKRAVELPYAPFVSGKCVDYASDEGKEFGSKACEPLDNHIILEDLRPQGYRMTNRRDPLDIDHLRLAIAELAKVHALSWAYKNRVEPDVLKKFPCLRDGLTIDDKDIFVKMLCVNIQNAAKTIEEALGMRNELSKALLSHQKSLDTIFDVFFGKKREEELDSLLRIKYGDGFGKDSPNPVPWRVITHGDCWSNNMLFKYDDKTGKPSDVVLVDLQMVRQYCIMPDLVTLIYTCTDVTLRKKHLAEIMELYVNTFNDICEKMGAETLPGFNLESFKFRFHRNKLLGLTMGMSLLPIMLKEDEAAQATNMESMDHGKDLGDMLSDVCKTTGTNVLFRNRVLGLVREMVDEGVI